MKRLIILLMLISSLSADEFLVKSFSRIENDGHARKYVKYDINGEACALIKVRTDIDAVINFDSNTGIPAEPELKTKGEYWVYVVEGERALKCVADGFIPKTIPLESAGKISKLAVYELQLSSKSRNIQILPITILSKPEDAEKYCDDILIGQGKTYKLALGKHTLSIKKQGYHSIDKEVIIDESHALFGPFDLDLIQQVSVEIRSNPEGARVYMNKSDMGCTPYGNWHFPGDYDLLISIPGYLDVNEEITVKGQNNHFTYELIKNSGFITLNISPSDAIVYINGREYSKKKIELIPGEYTLKIIKSGYLSSEEKIKIELSKSITKEYNLIKNIGFLSLNIQPNDATLEINKKIYAANKIIELPPGIHSINISKKGWDSIEENIEICLGQKLEKSYELIQQTGGFRFSVSPLDANSVLKDSVGTIINNWNGLKYISHLPVGVYQIESSSEGYALKKTNIEIENKFVKDVRVNLNKVEGISDINTEMYQHDDMIFVEGGTFSMGSNDGDNDEYPVHSVTVSNFYIGKYEVTQALYEKVTGYNPSHFRDVKNPVETVTWLDAVHFCNQLSDTLLLEKVYVIKGKNISADFNKNGYRLPTEAEWEYAAKTDELYKEGKHQETIIPNEYSWNRGNCDGQTHAVGRKHANELGIYDMSGNVWEWCWDWYANYTKKNQSDPIGPSHGFSRIIRGGSWGNQIYYARVSNRGNNLPLEGSSGIGFRLARSAP